MQLQSKRLDKKDLWCKQPKFKCYGKEYCYYAYATMCAEKKCFYFCSDDNGIKPPQEGVHDSV
jgi:hypothetical protein